MPNREEQYDFFTNTFDDEGEEEEKRTSAVKAGIKLEAQRSASMAGVPSGDGQTEHEAAQRVSRESGISPDGLERQSAPMKMDKKEALHP